MSSFGTTQKVLLSSTVVALALGAAGMGTYAAWSTSKTTTAQNVASGTFGLDLAQGTAATTLAVTDVAPGDTITRSYALTSTGSTTIKGIAAVLTEAKATPDAASSVLLDSTGKALNFTVSTCATPFTTAVTPAVVDVPSTTADETRPAVPADSCVVDGLAAPATPLVKGVTFAAAQKAVAGKDFGSLAQGAATGVQVAIAFPSTTGDDAESQLATATSDYNTYAAKAASMTLTFTATQRDGVAK